MRFNTQSTIEARLRYLWTGELVGSVSIPIVVILLAGAADSHIGFLSLYGLFLVMLILWQGAAYWYLKLRAHQAGQRIQANVLRWYRAFRVINWLLILLGVVLWVVQKHLDLLPWDRFNSVVGIALVVLAALEQINYHHVQLMYDHRADLRRLLSERRLKSPALRRDLERLELM